MALTAHKTVAMFMRYVHTEDDPVRKAAEQVATRRKSVVGTCQPQEPLSAWAPCRGPGKVCPLRV
jgi:hypothetical protein